MNYTKKLIKSLKIIIITTLLPYLITIILYFILNKDINKYLNYIMIIYYITTIIYLIKKYNIKIKPISLPQYYSHISLGISISCILNMLIFLIKKPIINNNIPLIILLIASSIIGPIYEEIIFRYIFYNKLKKFNSPKISILITTLVFALIHIYPIKILYAFILGLILNITYEKNKNILSPILIHISANTISLFLNTYSTKIIILSTLLLIISLKIELSHS